LPDLNEEFILQTDSSDVGIGACLLQQHEGVKHPVLNASKKLLGRERNYSVDEREALAIVWAVQKMHRFLYGQHFVLETNHRPLQYLNIARSKSPRLMSWSLALQPYHFGAWIISVLTILVAVVLLNPNNILLGLVDYKY